MKLDSKYTGFTKKLKLNPLQVLIVPHKDSEKNVIISSPTGSGKSTALFMLGYKWLEKNKKIVYVGPMKALVEQKFQELNDPTHPWYGFKKTVVTGDYFYNKDKIDECNEADIVFITPEALVSKIRNLSSEKNAWLRTRTGFLFVDEIHLIGENDRGPNLEAALIEFCYALPEVQLAALSATVPNVDEFAKWFTILNNKETIIIKSDYRPVPIKHIFLRCPPKSYKSIDDGKKIIIMKEIVSERNSEQFLVCVFSKAFGNKLKKSLEDSNIECEFHNANAPKSERDRIERAFVNGGLRVLISTSTLFTGVNLPARNVIITAVNIGWNDIKAHVIQQAAGRAGRISFDKEGFVHYLIPTEDFDHHVKRIHEGERITSQMHNTDVLATHFLGAIYLGRIRQKSDFYEWYKHTLAYTQFAYADTLTEKLLDDLVEKMVQCGMLLVEKMNNRYQLRHRGIISAQMVMNPFHLYDLARNLYRYFALDTPTDMDIAKAFSECKPYYCDYVTDEEKFCLSQAVLKNCRNGFAKMCSALHLMLLNHEVPSPILNWKFMWYQDADRIEECVLRLNNECEFWHEEENIRLMFLRIKRGLSREQARLALLKLSKSDIKKLHSVGIDTKEDLKKQFETAKNVVKIEKLKEIGMII